MTAETEPNLSSRGAQTALDMLLSYLVMQVRMRDGVTAPPLLDRNDLLGYVEGALMAPLLPDVDRPGLQWLSQRLRHYDARLPYEPPTLED